MNFMEESHKINMSVAVTIKILWDMMSCVVEDRYKYFGATCSPPTLKMDIAGYHIILVLMVSDTTKL
jgi:hypothetical protein